MTYRPDLQCDTPSCGKPATDAGLAEVVSEEMNSTQERSDMTGIGLTLYPVIDDSMDRVLNVLNTAFAADPAAIHALCANRVPCNRALADHPTVIVDTAPLPSGASYNVGTLGLINGIIDAVLGRRVAMAWSDGELPKQFLGFVEYTAPADVEDAAIESLRAALLARHRDGERDTRLLDWLTASCRDLIHSEGGKWEVIEYPGDPLVEERRAIGNTPREALIAAGALRVAHPYDAISASPPAASPEPFPALDDKKLSRAIDLDIEALDGCETLDERLTIARHLVALCEESARRSASVPPAASEPTEGASNAPSPRSPASPDPERASK